MFNFQKSNSKDFLDVEKQTHRELEGDDTITPLNNAPFLKQLTKLKRQTSLESLNSTLSLNSLTQDEYHQQRWKPSSSAEQGSIHSYKSFKLKVPESFKNLFSKSQKPPEQQLMHDLEYFRSKSTGANRTNNNNHEVVDSLTHLGNVYKSSKYVFTSYDNLADKKLNSLQSGKSLINVNKLHSRILKSPMSTTMAAQSLVAVTLNNTDQLCDAISSIIHNNDLMEKDLIENVKLIVRQSELIKKRQLVMSIFMCRVALFVFLGFMMALVFGFFYTLSSISNDPRFKRLLSNSMVYTNHSVTVEKHLN
jgi:hypothetical protein